MYEMFFDVEMNRDPKHLIHCILFILGCVRGVAPVRSKFPNFHVVCGKLDTSQLKIGPLKKIPDSYQ